MSNKHINHQHGLHTMNETRPKTKVSKKMNKAKAKARKAPLLAALAEARYGKKVEKAKKPRVSKKEVAAAKTAKKAAKSPAKKTSAAKKTAKKA